ncbi:MAG: hypothetical protein JSU70_09180 [Phycisphaerales bacterium]|nr:MAG: hypothetical protein JSU70_09180 [Phycisphaerales bacterium]
MKRCLFLLVFVATAGCMTSSTLNETMASWEGRHFTQLIEHWGPPHFVLEDDDAVDGNIYVWSTSSSAVSSGSAWARMFTLSRGETYWFWVDSEGQIYKWAWRRL